ncbi:MAG: hypothetical protein WHV66_08720, partial [Anaerolineales bacterium]
MFDLYLLPINLINGQENPELSNLWISAAPRRHERTRAGDLLLILLTFSRIDAISTEETQKILQNLATTYFRTHGSATAGLRAAVELLNSTLLHENLNKKDGNQISAVLNLAVLRKDTLFIAQAGPTHTFVLSQNETHDYHDPQMSARSLGVSRSVALRYYQAKLQPGDLFIFCPNPPQHWTTETLANSSTISFEQLLRRLLNQTGGNLQAAVIQVQAGNGQVKRLKPRTPLASTEEVIGSPVPPQSAKISVTPSSISLGESTPEKVTPGETQSQAVVTPLKSEALITPSTSPGVYIRREYTSAKKDTIPDWVKPPPVSQPEKHRTSFRKQLARVWFAGKRRLAGMCQKVATFLGRLMPGEDRNTSMPGSTMLFIAIAV